MTIPSDEIVFILAAIGWSIVFLAASKLAKKYGWLTAAGYNLDAVAMSLREIVASEVKTTRLVARFAQLLDEVLTPKFISVIITTPSGKQHFFATGGAEPSSAKKALQATLAKSCQAVHQPVVILRDIDRRSNQPLYAQMTKARVAAVVNLSTQGQHIGVILLGGKGRGTFTSKDTQLLALAGNEIAVSVQNSLRLSEIERFNATLKRRIDAATKELRASNAELQQLDEAKDEFVSMASHQLRTPLTSVKGYISMVLEGDAGEVNPMQKKLLEEAFTSSERMVHLINDFLNVSRLQTGKFMLDRRPIDLAKVTAQEVESLQTTAKAHNLKLTYRRPAYFPVLFIDEGKIRQVIMNFIDNAIYYSRERTAITVKLYVADGDAVLEVHDTGIGVPQNERARLFTKFFRATNARKQRPDGTGVGLFLAKKVIDGHKGRVVFESAEGEGSTFGFRLPIKRLSAAPSEDANELDK